MRKKDREIKDTKELEEILQKADVCRIAFAVDGTPYIVTMNFGYIWKDHLTLYCHCAKEGKKLELMKQNNTVCFEMDIDHEMYKGGKCLRLGHEIQKHRWSWIVGECHRRK